jgi:hypothetical protein
MSWFAKSTEMYTLKRPCRCYVFCVVTLGLSTSEISAEAFHVYSCLCPSGKFTLDNSVLNTASTTVTTYMAQNIQGFDTCARLRLLGLVTCCFATSWDTLDLLFFLADDNSNSVPENFTQALTCCNQRSGRCVFQALGRDRIIPASSWVAWCVGSLLLDRIFLFRQSQRGIWVRWVSSVMLIFYCARSKWVSCMYAMFLEL